MPQAVSIGELLERGWAFSHCSSFLSNCSMNFKKKTRKDMFLSLDFRVKKIAMDKNDFILRYHDMILSYDKEVESMKFNVPTFNSSLENP